MQLKIISLNMWSGGLLFDEIIAFLKEQDADIVLLQEVQNDRRPELDRSFRSMDVLREALQYPYEHFAHAYYYNLEPGKIAHGNAVLSKLAIKDSRLRYFQPPLREVFDDKPEDWPLVPRQLQHVVLEHDINVFNIHGVWDLNGDNYSDDRQAMERILLEETNAKSRVILGGDSNAKVSNPAIRGLESQLTNVFQPDLATTFNMRRKDNPGYATAAVDILFVSPDIKVVSHSCPDVDVSDHLPLLATLNIADI